MRWRVLFASSSGTAEDEASQLAGLLSHFHPTEISSLRSVTIESLLSKYSPFFTITIILFLLLFFSV